MTLARKYPTEQAEQRVVANYLNWRKLLWAHVPNGGTRNRIEAAKLVGQGVKRGVPDILIFTPPQARREPGGTVTQLRGVAIEMKRCNAPPSAVSPEQRQWLSDLREAGWAAHIACGAGEAISFIKEHYGP